MRLFALLWALCIGMTAAQLRGSDGSVRGRTGAPAPPSSGSPSDTISTTTCTEAGQFLPGPTCTSFYVCLNIYGSKVRFECAPGTMFSLEIGVCVHSYGTECAAEASSGPVPIPGIVSPVPPPGPPPVPQTPPPPPLPPVTGTTSPTSPSTQTCPAYELDPTGVYDCLEVGYFPHLSDCTRFYKCINTMGCILKGVLFRCPANYLFTDGRCQKESIVGPCNRQSDSVQTHQIRPVAQLNLQDLDDFFKASAYWEVMPFLPEEQQVLVPIMSDFSRGSDDRLTMG